MAEFAQILIRAKDETKTAFDSAARNMRGLEASAAKLGGLLRNIGIGAGVSLAGFAAFAKSGIDAADALNDMSLRLGVSVKDLASFKLAAEQSGTSLEGVGKGIQRLSLSMGQAEQGLKTQSQALKTLGITARDPKEAFFQLADAVANSSDPIKTNAALNDVLGRSYTTLLPLLQGGSQALRDSAAASETFAEQMSKLAPNADVFNDQLSSLKINAAGAAASVLNELVPAINRLFERFQDIGRLRDSGASLFEIITGGVSADTKASLDRVNADIAELEAKQKRLGQTRNPADTAELARLKAIRAELQLIAAERGMAPPEDSEYMQWLKALRGGGNGTDVFDGGGGGSGKKLDKDSILFADIAAAIKEADEELKRYADDRAFILEGDLERDNAVNALAQEWKDAGRALKEEMMTPLEKFNIEMGRLDVLLESGAIDFETYSRAVFSGFDGVSTKVEQTNDIAKELGLTFESAFEDAIVSGKKFSDVLKGLAQDMLRIFARKAITEPLANAAGNWVANLFPSANGNVFSSPALSAYSGSVVSSPTVFPFANGIGLMGEAGAEAILPLKRGRDGKLGVSMDGGGGVVVVQNVYNIDARGADAGVEQRLRRLLDESEERTVNRSVTQIQSMNQRGQLRLS